MVAVNPGITDRGVQIMSVGPDVAIVVRWKNFARIRKTLLGSKTWVVLISFNEECMEAQCSSKR